MEAGLAVVIGGIILEGMKLWSQERKHKFMNEYHEILTLIDEAKRREIGDYTDAENDVLKREFKIFLEAYRRELMTHNKEVISE